MQAHISASCTPAWGINFSPRVFREKLAVRKVDRVACTASSQPPEPSQAPDAPEPSGADPNAVAEVAPTPEVVQCQGSGAKAELAISLLLGVTLVYLPLTLASIGRFVWSKYTFTDKRMIIEFDSPIRKDTTQVTYDKLREIRSVYRGFGLWG
eukprot:jgi/Ulvmu1/11198/UM072_0034.1